MRKVSLALALVTATLAACADPPADEEKAILDIGGRPVPVSEFQRFVETSVQQDEPFLAGEVMSALLEQFIEEQLLLRAADDAGVQADPRAVRNRVAQLEHVQADETDVEPQRPLEDVVVQQVRIERLVEERLFSGLEVSESEIQAHYEANRHYFDRPETVTVSEILLEERHEADAVHEELATAPGRFEELASLHSRGPEAQWGGVLGTFGRGELPPSIEAAVFSLPVRRVSDVVETDFGYHIFWIEEKTAAAPLELEDVRDTIRVDLLRGKSQRELARYLEELKSKYEVKVHREHLNFAFLGFEPEGAESSPGRNP